MAIEYLTGLNAIVMKAIWNIEKRQVAFLESGDSLPVSKHHTTEAVVSAE